MSLFPLIDYWWFYLSFIGFVLLLLVADLGLFHRQAHAVSLREAVFWSLGWIALALAFNVAFYWSSLWFFQHDPRLLAVPGFDPAQAASRAALEFLTGYIVEKSLSVDNLFVFVVIFSYFNIAPRYQHRVLFFGIIGALICRSMFIGLGSVIMSYEWVVMLFGVFLLFTGGKILLGLDQEVDPAKNLVLKLVSKYLPVTTDFVGQRMFIVRDRRVLATPLLVALIVIECSDIVFAVDSVPAIFALTKEPLIVFTSNICAILGLRSLYFVLAAVVNRFHLLQYGLGLILIFVGLKMVWLNDFFGGAFPIDYSLGIITGILAGSMLLSLLIKSDQTTTGSKNERSE